MASPTGLSTKQLRLLGRLSEIPALKEFYLAGGSALGWYFGHRRSADLDLFSVSAESSLGLAVAALTKQGAQVQAETDVAVNLETGGVPVDLVRYPYPPLNPPKVGPSGFPVASLVDLGAMKLAAIARRGLRRDFWDLHVLLTDGRLALPALVKAYAKRYRRSASDSYHVARALTFFEDAERDDPRVLGLSEKRWAEMKRFFEERASALMLH